MPSSGTFAADDRSEVVEFVDRKLLNRGLVGTFSRIDGVSIHPVVSGLDGLAHKERRARLREVPSVWIGRARWYRKQVSVHVRPPGPAGREDAVPEMLTAAGMVAPAFHMSFGQCIFSFPASTPADELVSFSLGALRAVGAQPADDRWEWAKTVEVDTSGPVQ